MSDFVLYIWRWLSMRVGLRWDISIIFAISEDLQSRKYQTNVCSVLPTHRCIWQVTPFSFPIPERCSGWIYAWYKKVRFRILFSRTAPTNSSYLFRLNILWSSFLLRSYNRPSKRVPLKANEPPYEKKTVLHI